MRRRVALAVASAVTATFALTAPVAHAAPCAVTDPHDAAIADVDVETRLRAVATVIDDEVKAADRWSIGWGTGYAGLAALEFAAAPITKDHDMRSALFVDAAGASFGALTYYLLPLQITVPLRAVRKRWNEPDRCALLVAAEEEIDKQVALERLARTPLTQIFNAAINVGISLGMGLGYGQWRSAAISLVVGVGAGEAAAFTQPLKLYKAQQRYRTGQLADRAKGVSWEIAPLPVAGGGGVGARVVF